MREYGSNIILPSLDNLFSSEQERQDAKLEKIQILPLSELHPFEGHPFQVRDDEEMDKMVDSVKEYGVMTPAIVRPRRDGGYEIVAGHRRCHASRRAGVDTMPCIVRELDDDTAIILMVDSNCQREHILPSEKAKAYQMKLEAIKRQGRRSDLTSGQVGPKLEERRSNQIVAEKAGESVKQVQRFIRLNNLTPDLMQLVDDGRLKTTPAVELSYLTPEEQEEFLSYMEEEGCTPSLSQAQKLKTASKESVLTKDKINEIMSARFPSVMRCRSNLSKPHRKVYGFMACYYRYCALLRKAYHGKATKRCYFLLREDFKKFNRYQQQTHLLWEHRLQTLAEVPAYKSDLENQIEQLARQRKVLYRQKQEPERAAREEQIQKLTKQIKALRHEFYICADIEADAAMMQEKLRQAELAAQQERNEVKEDEYKRRSSRPDGARGASVFRGGY